MRQLFEWRADQVKGMAIAQVSRSPAFAPLVVQVLGPAQQSVELYRTRRPPRDVIREQFEQGKRAFTPARAQGGSNVTPWN
jgi:hypothetical protein